MHRSAYNDDDVLELAVVDLARDLNYFRKPTNAQKHEQGLEDDIRSAPAPDQQQLMDIVERAMDINQILYELCTHVNSYFRFQSLVVFVTAFVLIVFDCYYLIDELTSSRHSFRLSRADTMIFLCYELTTNTINVLVLVIACSSVTTVAARTGRLVHKVLVQTSDLALRQRLMQFSLQLNFNQPKFTAFGLFNIDATLIFTIVGATTTYLVILVQISDSAAPTTAGTLEANQTQSQ